MTNVTTIQAGGRDTRALRRYLVADSLADLRGPAERFVTLPQRVFHRGPGREFDLADEDELIEMYELVLTGARTKEHLAEYIDGETLARLWPEIVLDKDAQSAWEAAHPLLALGDAIPDDASAVAGALEEPAATADAPAFVA